MIIETGAEAAASDPGDDDDDDGEMMVIEGKVLEVTPAEEKPLKSNG